MKTDTIKKVYKRNGSNQVDLGQGKDGCKSFSRISRTNFKITNFLENCRNIYQAIIRDPETCVPKCLEKDSTEGAKVTCLSVQTKANGPQEADVLEGNTTKRIFSENLKKKSDDWN